MNDVALSPHEDGLCFDKDVGPWVEDKHRLVELYETLFSTGMKHKWDVRVCIDLFSGPGLVRVSGNRKFLWGSPIRALMVKDPFEKYIFCEERPDALKALRTRVNRMFPAADTSFIPGNCNDKTEEIKAAIPPSTKFMKVLSFCFADPYDLSVKFSTIQSLSERYVDFLILLALGMDANRNVQPYTNPTNRKIDEFLGLPSWREFWQEESLKKVPFPRFLAEIYSKQMESLGYLTVPFHRMKQIRSDKNLPLYHLALFSRSELAYSYWEQVLKYSTSQRSFEEEW